MSFSTYHSRLAVAERLLARDARDTGDIALHTAAAERAEFHDQLVVSHANQILAPKN